MKYSKTLLMGLTLFIFTACGIKNGKHIASIPYTPLTTTGIYNKECKECRDARKYGNYLVQADAKPIYLVVEDKTMVQDETGNGKGVLPNTFRIATLAAAAHFGPKVVVVTGTKAIEKYYLDEDTSGRLFDIEGGITAFNENNHVIDSGIDFGLDFGKGKGETDLDNKFRNTDKVSSLTINMFFKQNGEIFTDSEASVDIHQANRGYNFGLSINSSGFGVSAYNTKKEGLGISLKRLLHYTIMEMLKEVVDRKGLIPTKNPTPTYSTPTPSSNIPTRPTPTYNAPTPSSNIPTRPTPTYNAPTPSRAASSTSKLNDREKSFLNRIKQREGNR